MARELTAQQIIEWAVRLPIAEREQIVDVLSESLMEEHPGHGPEEPAEEVEAAWSEELARRIADVDSGRVKTIPAEEAERMIRENGRRTL